MMDERLVGSKVDQKVVPLVEMTVDWLVRSKVATMVAWKVVPLGTMLVVLLVARSVDSKVHLLVAQRAAKLAD